MVLDINKEFSPRLNFDLSESEKEFYFSDKNIYQKYNFGIPNCTAYTFGRIAELYGFDILQRFKPLNPEYFIEWTKQEGFELTTIPSVGDVAVFKGHCSVVEEVVAGSDDLMIKCSNSQWNGSDFFCTLHFKTNNFKYKDMDLISFIHIGNFKKKEVNQVEVFNLEMGFDLKSSEYTELIKRLKLFIDLSLIFKGRYPTHSEVNEMIGTYHSYNEIWETF